ncbi:hypothetical protein [Bacillus paramycoides]|uniref:hypothetical protein n=1 Tax=Bacillus paramycoides TaxID=2026194 RepID=UPI0037F9C315
MLARFQIIENGSSLPVAMVADWMNSCFLISHPIEVHVVYTRESFCSSSSYLIMLVQIDVTILGGWKKNKTSFTVIKVQINN